jgi:hypothetical protein
MAGSAGRLNAKPLEGWITLTKAADVLGVSRWAAHKMCESPGKDSDGNDRPADLQHVRYVGDPVRPVYLVREVEVHALKRKRAAEEAARASRQAAEKRPAGSAGQDLLAASA